MQNSPDEDPDGKKPDGTNDLFGRLGRQYGKQLAKATLSETAVQNTARSSFHKALDKAFKHLSAADLAELFVLIEPFGSSTERAKIAQLDVRPAGIGDRVQAQVDALAAAKSARDAEKAERQEMAEIEKLQRLLAKHGDKLNDARGNGSDDRPEK